MKGGARIGSGRKPLSAEQRQLRGLPPVPLKATKPIPPVVSLTHPPRVPRTLDDNGRKVWRKAIKQLLDQGLLADVDLEMVSGYAHAVQRALAAERFLQEHGSQSYTTKDGDERAYPQVAIAQTAWAEARRYQERFGFSAYDRIRIKSSRGAGI